MGASNRAQVRESRESGGIRIRFPPGVALTQESLCGYKTTYLEVSACKGLLFCSNNFWMWAHHFFRFRPDNFAFRGRPPEEFCPRPGGEICAIHCPGCPGTDRPGT